MDLKAAMRERSGLEARFRQRPSDGARQSPARPLGIAMTVYKPPSARSGFFGPPTRTGSLSPESLENVRHSDDSSIECDSSTSPHSEHTASPAARLQPAKYGSAIFSGEGFDRWRRWRSHEEFVEGKWRFSEGIHLI